MPHNFIIWYLLSPMQTKTEHRYQKLALQIRLNRTMFYQTFECKNTKKERLNQLYYVNLHKYILKK